MLAWILSACLVLMSALSSVAQAEDEGPKPKSQLVYNCQAFLKGTAIVGGEILELLQYTGKAYYAGVWRMLGVDQLNTASPLNHLVTLSSEPTPYSFEELRELAQPEIRDVVSKRNAEYSIAQASAAIELAVPGFDVDPGIQLIVIQNKSIYFNDVENNLHMFDIGSVVVTQDRLIIGWVPPSELNGRKVAAFKPVKMR